MLNKPIVLYTDHEINRTLCYSFAKGSDSLMCHVNNFNEFDKTIATYGYLRGTGEAIKKVKNFFYMDHGYFKQSKRKFQKNKVINIALDGYFRVVYNDYWSDASEKKSSDRFDKLSLNIKDKKKQGDHIIISEPIPEAIEFYNLGNWTEVTINKLKKYTDRKFIIHSRSSEIKLDDLLKNAWAFVSDHSSAGFKAMMAGVPAYFTNSTLGKISSIENIEDHDIDYSVFYNLAYEQWTISEIQNGEAWHYLSQKIK
tara:strand:- start:8061 stop:8825 length:765 start_codon:yes stop_codon:yes gene_type:complete